MDPPLTATRDPLGRRPSTSPREGGGENVTKAYRVGQIWKVGGRGTCRLARLSQTAPQPVVRSQQCPLPPPGGFAAPAEPAEQTMLVVATQSLQDRTDLGLAPWHLRKGLHLSAGDV